MEKEENILIIGAGIAGKLLAESILSKKGKYNIVGFIDDNVEKDSTVVKDIKLLGNVESISEILNTYKVDRLIIAIPSEKGAVIRKILLQVGEHENVSLELLPRISEIVFTGAVSLEDVRPIDIVDIVGEMIVKEDQMKVQDLFLGKTIFVTGGGGSIGSELSKQIYLLRPKKLIILELCERNLFNITNQINKLRELNGETEVEFILGNATNEDLIERIFEDNKIDSVFHAAAYKHVPIIEHQVYEGVNNNAYSTQIIAELAYKHKVEKFILITTDKAAEPIGIMGKTKRLAEKIVHYFDDKSTSTIFSAVRFGNVFNSSGSAVEVFLEQIEKENRIHITDPAMTRFFMTIPEAVHLVLQAWYLAEKGKFYMLEMGDPINILELAMCMVVVKKKKLSTFKFEVVGTRPGEKKHEVLFDTSHEKKVLTEHQRIFSIMNKENEDFNQFEKDFAIIKEMLSKKEIRNHSKDGESMLRDKLNEIISN